jgi:hypothetical protein
MDLEFLRNWRPEVLIEYLACVGFKKSERKLK